MDRLTWSPMVVPDDQAFFDEFGVQPEPTDDVGGRLVRFENADGEERLEVFLGLTEQSVSYRWWRDGVLVAEVVRDAVTDVRIAGRARTSLEIEYGVPGFHGVLCVDVHPKVVVTDRILRVGAS